MCFNKVIKPGNFTCKDWWHHEQHSVIIVCTNEQIDFNYERKFYLECKLKIFSMSWVFIYLVAQVYVSWVRH